MSNVKAERATPWNAIGIVLILIAGALLLFVDASNPAMVIATWGCAIGAIVAFAKSRAERH